MGGRGPAPAPRAIQDLKGNPRKTPKKKIAKEVQVTPPDQVPQPPRGMPKPQKAIWNDLAPILWKMGVLTSPDIPTFKVLVKLLWRWEECESQLDLLGNEWDPLAGHFQLGPGGVVKQSELFKAAMDTAKLLRNYFAVFGMEPSSRTRIQVKGLGKGEEDPMKKFLAKQAVLGKGLRKVK